ncbi:hypothetical protein PBY51_008099 [Eleginops maclovinus]|uniref:Platelet endothelial cell adhesion molecule n=1 Tax=Eleginops maclovinus TaxID=56733 RepID=A0AAN7XBE9_ELEMC|nr:hypothetical protein PBY51_008099 [Eleginops maclovinus]
MDSRPPNLMLLLLLTSLLHSSYTIDTVGLTILPRSPVQSGTPVTLRCQVRVSHDRIPHLTQSFLLRRDDVVINSSTTTADSFMYELNPARAADSGIYECQVAVKNKSRTSLRQKLDVKGLQTPILYLSNTSPYADEEFTASCSAPEEKGSLIFHFSQRLRNGNVQSIKKLAPTGNSAETTLILRGIGDSLLYCDYEVNLVSGVRRSNSSNSITMIVRELYIIPIMNVLPSTDVYEGEVIEVVCKVINPPQNVDVFLTRDRTILKQAPVGLSHRFTAQEGDSGELVCKAEWGNVQKQTYKTIRVKELFSKPQLTVKPVDIFEGDRFQLTCSVSVYVPEKITNASIRFSIYKHTVKIASSDTYRTVAQPSVNGNYTCKAHASSLTHSFIKESQTVVVKVKVPVSTPMLSVVGRTLVLGKRFRLLCHSDNGTLPITYTLRHPEMLPEVLVVNMPGERAIFNCPPIYKTSELKNFLCHAKNSHSRHPEVVLGLQLLRSDIIEPVSKPVLTMLPGPGDISEGQDLTVFCSVQRGTLPVSFTWYHTETESALASKTFNKLEGSHNISNVQGEHRGGYYCESTNQANETKQSLTITIKVKIAVWKKGLIVGVIIICILLILALIFILVFKRRLLLFKRRRTGELSVKSASTKAERLSLTQVEVNDTANVTPGMIGKSVWSEHASGSESEDQSIVTAPEKLPEPRYTEVQPRQTDPDRAPVKKCTDTVYSEVRKSKQGAPEQADGGSLEYAELNHDTHHRHSADQGNHGDHPTVQDDYLDEIDDSVQIPIADHGEGIPDPMPEC